VETHITSDPDVAAAYLRRGQCVAFPTETVYGLGADAFDPGAVARIFEAKGRPSDNPLIVHVAARAEVVRVAAAVPEAARALMDAFWPGPLTLVLPKHPRVPSAVTAGLDTVGVRWPRHLAAQALLAACGVPVAAPSANRSGRPSPTTWRDVEADLGGRIACILRGGPTEAGLESTVVDATRAVPVVLRPGAVPVEALRAVVPSVALPDVAKEREADAPPRSPGTRHRHYAPDAAVCLVAHPREAVPGARHAYVGLDAPQDADAFARTHVAADVEAYARRLFAFFREAERAGCTRIYAQAVPPTGLGRALMDRLRRAAER
jgi:L-threonylcarbamoyladenylate synthase